MNNFIKKHFTFDQFLAEAQTPWASKHKDKYVTHSQDTDSESVEWTGTKNWNEAIKFAQYGWPTGTKKLKKALDNLKGATAPALECSFDVAGEEVDIGRFLTGDPENMIEYNPVNREGIKFVEVYISFAYHCGHTAKDVIKRGAIILSNIDALEANGYRCKIIGYSKNGYRSGRSYKGLELEVVLKEYDEALELDRMAFCLINPSMLRRLGFKLIERFNPKQANKNYGKGVTFLAPENALHIDRDMFSESTINYHFKNNLAN